MTLMTASLNQLTDIATALNAAGKEVTVKTLPSRGPRKGETWSKSPAGMVAGRALGSARAGDTTTAATIAGGGREQTMTKVCGIGKEMVRDLDSVKRRASSTYAADRRAAARERMEEKLDALLATV